MKKPISPIISGRTRFARDIVAEFWMPRKPSRKAVILCDGCPSLPSRQRVGEFFARKGYWVFHPRYRGAWESDGSFLKVSPDEDVLLVARSLNEGFLDIVTRQMYFLDISEIVVVGASFGGTAAMLSLKDPLIAKAVALSPVIDWRAKSKAEPFDLFVSLLSEGFGGAYRTHNNAWRKLKSGRFYSPLHDAKKIDTARLFVVHAKDDLVVPIAPLRTFSKQTKFKPLILDSGGHFSARSVMEREMWSKVAQFLKKPSCGKPLF